MGIKEKIAFRKLKKFKQGKREASLRPLSEIKTIALLYNVEEISWKSVRKIINYFEEYGKSVTTLGYFNSKELTHEYTPNYKHMFFCNEQLSFWKLPMPNTLHQFITTDYDYLINLDVKGDMVLQAMSTFSQAKTRIGVHMEEYQFSQDFMIKGGAKDGIELFEQLKNYLNK
ncbi:MAG: hypothetical protein JXR19_10095 [Bacteroidia bacterium]